MDPDSDGEEGSSLWVSSIARHNPQTAATHLAEMWLRRHKYPKALEQYDWFINQRPESAQIAGRKNLGKIWAVKPGDWFYLQAPTDFTRKI